MLIFHEMQVRDVLRERRAERCIRTAYINPKFFNKKEFKKNEFIELKSGNKITLLNLEALPVWDTEREKNIIRLHGCVRECMDLKLGDSCNVTLLEDLKELSCAKIKITGIQRKAEDYLANNLRQYLVGNAIQENSVIPLDLGFCQKIEMELFKLYPFSRGIITSNTDIQILTKDNPVVSVAR